MALVIADRVQQTSVTAGTGTLTLNGTVTGYQSFAAVGNGNTTYYTIVDPIANTWEVGLGTYTASGTTLSRTTVLSSSSAGAPVSFAANTKNVFCTYPANRAVYGDATGNVVITSLIALGYGSGSGGTVTQATSKATTVTLNKPAGKITMNSAALASNAVVRFTFINSFIGLNDVLIASPALYSSNYVIEIAGITGNAGFGTISVRNINAASLSEPVEINFAVIKGAII